MPAVPLVMYPHRTQRPATWARIDERDGRLLLVREVADDTTEKASSLASLMAATTGSTATVHSCADRMMSTITVGRTASRSCDSGDSEWMRAGMRCCGRDGFNTR